MKLYDECPFCGAVFRAQGYGPIVQKTWVGWVNLHAVCRKDTREMYLERDETDAVRR